MNQNAPIKIAVVTLQYPPIGGGYSERITGFIKQWIRRGIVLHVVTAEPKGLGLHIDSASESDVIGTRTVTRLKTLRGFLARQNGELSGVARLLWKILNLVLPPDGQLFWSMKAKREVERLYRNGEIDIVLTTSTPYSVHMAGLWLSKRYSGLAWVADFRDPWTTNYQKKQVRQLPGRHWLNRWIEQRIYDKADAVVINTHQNLADLHEAFRLPKEKALVIQNGFDPDIVTNGEPKWLRDTGRFRLGYIGGFRGDWFEGAFLQALSLLKSTAAEAYEKLDVLLVGTEEISDSMPKELGIDEKLHPCGFHPRDELGGWFASMDALLLVLPENNGKPLGWVPQRLYLYLSSGLPIFCVAPEGEAASYIQKSNSGVVLPPDDTQQITMELKSWILSSPPTFESRATEVVNSFSKVNLAMRFRELFKEVIAKKHNLAEAESGL